jgi:hypothetical protein
MKYLKNSMIKVHVLHTMKCRQANYIGHRWGRNCLTKPVNEGKIKKKDGSEESARKKT